MKKLLILLFSILISFNSYGDLYGEYTELGKADDGGDTHYMNFDTIKERDGYVYWWHMTSNADDSSQTYFQGDCDLTRVKVLQGVFSDKPMGQGETIPAPGEDNWVYLPPYSMGANMLEISCEWLGFSSKEKQTFIEELKVYVDAQIEQDGSSYEVIDDQLSTLKSAYVNNIAARVKTFWRYQGADDDWTCNVYVLQSVDGVVEAVNIQNCTLDNSDHARAFKNSIERAVYKSSPLPSAPDDAVFNREIMFTFRTN